MELTLEDLVPNALIELIENNVDRRVSYSSIIQYGYCVKNQLESMSLNYEITINRDTLSDFEETYKDIFDFYEIDDVRYIKLKDDINTKYLREKFRVCQSLNVLNALVNENSKQALGIVGTSKILSKKK